MIIFLPPSLAPVTVFELSEKLWSFFWNWPITNSLAETKIILIVKKRRYFSQLALVRHYNKYCKFTCKIQLMTAIHHYSNIIYCSRELFSFKPYCICCTIEWCNHIYIYIKSFDTVVPVHKNYQWSI